MNISLIALIASLGLIVVYLTGIYRKYSLYIFYVLLFMSLSRLTIDLGIGGESSLRLPLAVLLLFGNIKRIMLVVDKLARNGTFYWSTLWFLNICYSWYYSNDSNTFLYESVGNYIFFILTASYFYLATEKELITMLKIVALSQLPGILLAVESLRPVIQSLGFDWGTVYHQRSAQAGVYMLPLLLLWIDQIDKKSRATVAIILAIIFTLLVIVSTTGARTPSIVFALMLIYWFRKRKMYLIIVALVAGAGVYLASNIAEEEIRDRYNRAYSAVRTGNLGEEQNVEFRYEHFVIGLRAFSESPIYGRGHDSWMGIIGEYKGIQGYNTAPHNELVRLLVEYGIIGFTFFFMYIYTCCKGCVNSGEENIMLSSRYSFVIIVIGMILLNLFHNALFSRYFFFTLGASAGLRVNRIARLQMAVLKGPGVEMEKAGYLLKK